MTVPDEKLDKMIENLRGLHPGPFHEPPYISMEDVQGIIAHLERLLPVDAGTHVIVPVEPTEAMLQAGMSPFMAAHDPFYNKNEPCGPIYRAMIKEQNK